MRALALLLLAPLFVAWTAGGEDDIVRETAAEKRIIDSQRTFASGIASGTPDGVEVVLNFPLRDTDGSGVLGLSIPHGTFNRRADLDAADAVYVRYREYDRDGGVRFDNEGVAHGPFVAQIDELSNVSLRFELSLDDPALETWRGLVVDDFRLRALGEPEYQGGGSAGGEVVVGVTDEPYYDPYYDDDGYDSGGCDGDDWGDGDDYESDDSGGGCDGDDWDSGGEDSGGCDGDGGGSSEAPSCDCEGDAIAGAPGQWTRRSRWIMRAFNWAPWLFVVGFIVAMKRRPLRVSARRR